MSKAEPQQATPSREQYNAGDPDHVARATTDAKKREARVRLGLSKVMGDADSRAWLHSMLEEAAPFAETFTGNSTTFYNCGRQAWAKVLVAKLMNDFLDQYVTMMKEAKNG